MGTEGAKMGERLMNYLATEMPKLTENYGGKWVLLGEESPPGVLFAHEELEQVQNEARKRRIVEPYIVPVPTPSQGQS